MPRSKAERPRARRPAEKNPPARGRLRDLERALKNAADPRRAAGLARFFKTGRGEYGEGDRFIGITVPALRKLAREHVSLGFRELARLLACGVHEHRLAALEILVAQYEVAERRQRERIVSFYLRQTGRINNWDLVDASAPYILGDHLKTRSRKLLDDLAGSANLWERRIAIVTTLALIRGGETGDTYRIARKLLDDEHDLIHKAVGWALREAGKISPEELLRFLSWEYRRLPRTTLRYAIERFPAARRRRFLAGDFD
jgi:3-methyladenine DNA glycosylase AlkD